MPGAEHAARLRSGRRRTWAVAIGGVAWAVFLIVALTLLS